MTGEEDILGHGLVQETIALGADDEGPVVATLVHRPCAQGSPRALLYLHGFNDYYFQVELADRTNAAGVDFYALDLRKYGRSIRPGQTVAFVESLETYYEELDAAVERIRGRDRHSHLTLLGHSTGGLTATLYTADREHVDALILNSPFYDFRGKWWEEIFVEEVASRLGAIAPMQVIRGEGSPHYAWSLHRGFDRGGEWAYNLEWKRENSIPVRAGWLRAIRGGHERVQETLELGRPSLVMYAQRASDGEAWDDRVFTSDIVLDVADIDRFADSLRPRATEIAFDGGMHDLFLSRAPVRDEVYRRMFAWLAAHSPT